MSTTRHTAPADGERRALRNLSAQYRVAATLIRRAISDGELEWVRLVDPDAGRLDDIVVGRAGRVDAYQVKWSDYRGRITFRQLVTPTKVSDKPYPAPFEILADGLRRLRRTYPDAVVTAHYLTHDAPSSDDGDTREGNGTPGHLQGFMRHAWPLRGSWHRDAEDGFRRDWRLKIEAIANCVGHEGPALDHLLADCALDLGFDLNDPSDGTDGQADREIADLAHVLMDRVSASAGALRMTRQDILRAMGWTGRFELAFRHEFPVDERLYRPVEETVQAIRQAIGDLDRGYLALVGPPGSGKSTTLTQTLRYAAGIRLVRYYAFVRDDPRPNRGEARDFLGDLCVSLESQAPRHARPRGLTDDIETLRDRLASLLAAFSEEWRTSGTKTVILVDGLDHIEREQSPLRSLVHELPHPDRLPDGVILILGTQQVGLRGDARALRPIVSQLRETGRTLEMARLTRANVRSIVEAVVDATLLDPESHDRIGELCGGHPLALAYLVKRLSSARDATEAKEMLVSATPYGGEIEADYRNYWNALEDEPDVRDLLGLASRFRGAVELATLERLGAPRVLERFVATAQHYFREDSPETWRFFHNSFRQFVQVATSRTAFGRPDPSIAAEFHARLAATSASAPAESRFRWQRLYHLELAGQNEGLIEADHQRVFRSQFLAGRSRWEIEDDIHRCMRAAAAAGNASIVLGLFLAHKELGDRSSALETVDLRKAEADLAPPEDLASILIVGDELTVSPDVALGWAGRLSVEGRTALANRIFDLAEPLDALSGVELVDVLRDAEVLDAWVRVAWMFRPLATVTGAIGHVRCRPILHEGEDDQSELTRSSLLESLGDALLAHGEAELLDEFLEIADRVPYAEGVRLHVDVARVERANRDGSGGNGSREPLARLLAAMPPDEVDRQEAAWIASLILGSDAEPELADPYLSVAGNLLRHEHLDAHDDSFACARPTLEHARARAARGAPFDPLVHVPDPAQPRDRGRTLFQRILVVVANLWGEAIRGSVAPPSEVVRRMAPALLLYRRDFGETREWIDWYVAERAKAQLFVHVLEAARAHGREAFLAVLEAMRREWTKGDGQDWHWDQYTRRTIALAAFRIDGDAGRTRIMLEELESAATVALDMHERIDQLEASLNARLEIGDVADARRLRDRMLATSFGISSDKDGQIEEWADVVASLVREQATEGDVLEAARLVLDLFRVVQRHQRGAGRSDAMRGIMASLSAWSPSIAIQVGTWFLDRSMAGRSDVLSGLAIGQLRSRDPDVVADTLVLIARSILPFDIYPPDELVTSVADVRSGTLAAIPRVASALAALGRTVRTQVQYPKAFEEALGMRPRAPPAPTDPGQEPIGLTPAGGEFLSKPQLERLAAVDAPALAAALRNPAVSPMSWGSVVAALPPIVDRASLLSIGRWLIATDAGPAAMVELVRRAGAVGESKLAADATSAAISGSRPRGWIRRHDGGSRLHAAECIVSCDPVHGHRRTLQLLVEDHIENELPVRGLLGELDRILPLVAPGVGRAELWPVLREHIGNLAEVTEANDAAEGSPFSATVPPFPTDLAARLLLRDMAHSAADVARSAQRGLTDLLRDGDHGGFVISELVSALRGSVESTMASLAVLANLAWIDPARVRPFVEPIRALARDPRGVIRQAAHRVLLLSGEALPEKSARRRLPAIYRMHLPGVAMPERSLRGARSHSGRPLPDSSDGVDLSRIFHESMRRLSASSGYPFSTLAHRFAQVMRELAPPDAWSADAERALMSDLKATGLMLPFRRPRSLVAHQAFGVIAAELCDAGELDWPPPEAGGDLHSFDPRLSSRGPDPRPDWLSVPVGADIGRYPADRWLGEVADALDGAGRPSDGLVVLAEHVHSVGLDGGRPEEIRVSLFAHRLHVPDDGRMPGFGYFLPDNDWLASDYPQLPGAALRPSVAISGGPRLVGVDFLALNPFVGRHLGWQVSSDGLFRWEDAEGRIMAESIWWQDGNVVLHERAGQDEAAHAGWVVLASAAGWEAIRNVTPGFVMHRAVGRRTAPDDEEGGTVRVAVDMRPSPRS